MREVIEVFNQFRVPDGHRYAVLEGNRDCNRNCSYCLVPQKYQKEEEVTVSETYQTIDWLYNQGYRLFSYLGGEPLAPFQTKEGISFFEQTAQIVNYAAKKGMMVNVTTNGDFVDREKVKILRRAGLSSFTMSLHTYSTPGLRRVALGAKLAADEGIIPIIQTVLTTETGPHIPAIAAFSAQNGFLFSVGIVQEKGGEFSSAKGENSLLPRVDEQRKVFSALLQLKNFGFVRNNRNYLINAPSYFPNGWTCDHRRDRFIHIGAGGTVDVCSDVRSKLKVLELESLQSPSWREIKRDLVANCGNCLFHCYYETENPNLARDIPTGIIAGLIRMKQNKTVRLIGEMAVRVAKVRASEVNWELSI